LIDHIFFSVRWACFFHTEVANTLQILLIIPLHGGCGRSHEPI
jgi:hypothetical protein